MEQRNKTWNGNNGCVLVRRDTKVNESRKTRSHIQSRHPTKADINNKAKEAVGSTHMATGPQRDIFRSFPYHPSSLYVLPNFFFVELGVFFLILVGTAVFVVICPTGSAPAYWSELDSWRCSGVQNSLHDLQPIRTPSPRFRLTPENRLPAHRSVP